MPCPGTGCDALGITRACTTEARPGIGVVLMDAATSGPILDGEAVITAIDGMFRDSIRFTVAPGNYNVAMPLAYERDGNYLVQARVTGYLDWAMDDIRVRDGGCHVETRTLFAHLEPAG